MNERDLERVLRRSNKTLEAERSAVAENRWADYLARRVPAPSRFNVLQFSAWRAAHDHALRIGHTATVCDVLVCPIWYGSNESEEPESAWSHAVLVTFGDGSFELYENAALEPAVVVADVEQARLGFVVRSRDYAPDIELPFRARDYATVESRRIERVVRIKTVVGAPPATVPERPVPPFSVDAEPAITLHDIDPALAARVSGALERLRVFPEPLA